MQIIGLCMIVKNEAEVILRCLESARPIVNYVLIEDTGSTDGTQKIIREWLDRVGIPGEVYDEPWQDFAYNRSHALARLRENKAVDYGLIIDADDVLELPPGFKTPHLKADSYTLEIWHHELRHWRPHLVRNALPWRYEGVLHEFLSCPVGSDNRRTLPEQRSQKRLAGARIRISEEGARRQISGSERYRSDAMILEKALAAETDPFLISRYTFYLAQSYRDCGERQKALANYLKRAELGFWDQEVFVSLYQAAKLKADLGLDEEDVLSTYLRAQKVCKDRAEALHGAASFCRVKERFEQGYRFAQRALGIKVPAHGLFLEHWIYDYGVLDEYAITAYWIGKFDDCLRACKRLLREGKIPPEMRDRIEQNARFARGKSSARQVTDRKPGSPGSAPSDRANEPSLSLRKVYTERDVNGAAFDQTACQVGAKVLISSTGRTGSYLLCRAMIHHGIGIPHEYFNVVNAAIIGARYGLGTITSLDLETDGPTRRAYIAALLERRTKNGIFAAKIHRGQFRQYFENAKHPELFQGANFIHNYREDLIAQAVSFHMSLLTGRWGVDDDITTPPALSPQFFDNHLIAKLLVELAVQDSEWRLFFAKNSIRPLFLSYEAMKDDLGAALRTIVNSFSLQLPPQRFDYVEPPVKEHRGAAEPSKAEVKAGFEQWLTHHQSVRDEVFTVFFRAAEGLRAEGRPFDEVIAVYDRASTAAPHRAEALHGASRICRWNNKFAEGYEYAKRGLAIPPPTSGQSIQQWIYDYGLLDEFAVNAYWIERYQDCLDACQRLLREGKMPSDMYDRVKRNADFATTKLRPAQLNVG